MCRMADGGSWRYGDASGQRSRRHALNRSLNRPSASGGVTSGRFERPLVEARSKRFVAVVMGARLCTARCAWMMEQSQRAEHA